MARTVLAIIGAVICLGAGLGCGSQANADAAAVGQSPAPTKPDATAADRAEQINSNPNISPDVKKVIGGGGKGL